MGRFKSCNKLTSKCRFCCAEALLCTIRIRSESQWEAWEALNVRFVLCNCTFLAMYIQEWTTSPSPLCGETRQKGQLVMTCTKQHTTPGPSSADTSAGGMTRVRFGRKMPKKEQRFVQTGKLSRKALSLTSHLPQLCVPSLLTRANFSQQLTRSNEGST